jgi:cyclophilin family peptidyl-prolyl cis-trans isomerase/HEAT repeat protein
MRLIIVAVAAAVAACAGAPRNGTPTRGAAPAAEWERVLAAEDARAMTAAHVGTLRVALRSAAPQIRMMAVRALGRTERAAFVGDIAPLLRDGDPAVRSAAAHALGNVTRDSAYATVRELLLDALPDPGTDPLLAAALGETLGRMRHDSASARVVAPRIAALLRNGDAARLGALRGLHFMARQAPARSAVAAAVQGDIALILRNAATPRERALAVAVATASGSAQPDLLRSAAADVDWTVRREAAVAAVTLADSAAVRALVTPLLADPAPQVRHDALRTLARRGGCAHVARTVRDPDPSVAIAALNLAGTSCRAQVPAALLDSVTGTGNAPHGWHRAAHATVALAAVDSARGAARARELARHVSPFARTYAARAAAAARNVPLLRTLAADPHHNVRTAAVTGLHAVAGRAADDIYIEQLGAQDSELIQAAAAALEGSRSTAAAARLLDALDRVTQARAETSRDARAALIARLRELGSARHADRLRPYLTDFDPAIAAAAAAVLTHWTGTTAAASPQPLPRLPLPTWSDAQQLERSRFVIEMEDGGEFEITLLPFIAPTNAWRFARLARDGWFDGLTVHRVVPNFVVQGGSPGANEYSGDASFTRDELGAPNWRGTVGLSTRGRDTGDAQFYINLIDNVRLDHDYTVYGVVTRGMDVVNAMLEGTVIRAVREVR